MKTGERRKGPACSCSRRAGQRQDRLGLDHGATWHFTHCEAAAAGAPTLSSSSSCLVSLHRLSLPGKQKVPGLSEAAGGSLLSATRRTSGARHSPSVWGLSAETESKHLSWEFDPAPASKVTSANNKTDIILKNLSLCFISLWGSFHFIFLVIIIFCESYQYMKDWKLFFLKI